MAFARDNTSGWQGTGIAALQEKIISASTMVAMLEDSPIKLIADDSPLNELQKGGTVLKFKRFNRPTVGAYTAGVDITYGRQDGDEVSVELDKAFYGAMRLDDVDKQTMQNVDVEGLSRWGRLLKEEHDDNEALALWTTVLAKVQATAVMATPRSLDGLFYKFNEGASGVNILKADEKRTPTAGGRYILDPFRKAALAYRRTNLKGNNPWAIVSPEIEEMLEFMEDRRMDAGGEGYKDAITRSKVTGRMVVRGFEIIPWNKISGATYFTKTNTHPIIFGSKAGLAAGRFIDKTEQGRFEKQFGEYIRQLVTFGAAIWDTRHFGIDYLQM